VKWSILPDPGQQLLVAEAVFPGVFDPSPHGLADLFVDVYHRMHDRMLGSARGAGNSAAYEAPRSVESRLVEGESPRPPDLFTQFSSFRPPPSRPNFALASSAHTGILPDLKGHVKDHSSRRGLLKMVARRRSLLDYLKDTAAERYTKLIESLNLRK
jgi:hypothetical protein